MKSRLHSLRKRSLGFKSRRVFLFSFCIVFFQLFLLGTVYFEYCYYKSTWTSYIVTMLLSCTLLYDVRVCICIYKYPPCISAAALCTILLVAAAVRHRVPDGKFCCRGSLHLIPLFSFSSSFKHNILLMHVSLRSTVVFAASIFP